MRLKVVGKNSGGDVFLIPMRGNEERNGERWRTCNLPFLIPMRGNEGLFNGLTTTTPKIPNPHEG